MSDPVALDLLRSIDASLKALVALAQRRAAGSPAGTGSAAPGVASDRDLDGRYGDPEIKAKDPRDWSGPSMRGKRFSECSAAYLDLFAERADWFAKQADEKDERTSSGKPKGEFIRADAARARGWAARIRSGKHTPASATTDAPDSGWASDPPDEDAGGGWA